MGTSEVGSFKAFVAPVLGPWDQNHDALVRPDLLSLGSQILRIDLRGFCGRIGMAFKVGFLMPSRSDF